MADMGQQKIVDRAEVSRVTVSKRYNAGGWKEARAAKNTTRPKSINKLLFTIDTLIMQVNESNDPALVTGLGDKLIGLSSVIEGLDRKVDVVDAIGMLMAFSRWIGYRSSIGPEVIPGLVKTTDKYQNLYITEQMGIR